ncbi:uncharacterized protein LOC135389188 [Ornithodoros turicata]|uniref:uncharacterized protein LOC135389188 n=1 Tax=Ornithodoros turicata TaxID=34597 RepID=UPI003139153F
MGERFENVVAQSRGIALKHTAPYHPAANGLAERVIRDLKQFINVYPDFRGGWKCCRQAAVAHHSQSHTARMGCSPHFAAYGEVPVLPADRVMGIDQAMALIEKRRTPAEEQRYRRRMKRNFDRRHNIDIPNIEVGDQVLVRKGLGI